MKTIIIIVCLTMLSSGCSSFKIENELEDRAIFVTNNIQSIFHETDTTKRILFFNNSIISERLKSDYYRKIISDFINKSELYHYQTVVSRYLNSNDTFQLNTPVGLNINQTQFFNNKFYKVTIVKKAFFLIYYFIKKENVWTIYDIAYGSIQNYIDD